MEKKLPSLYSSDPEDQELITEIKDQYKDLSESLKSRKLPFDPKWMALAQGFLAPTQTGSFGESLGYAAKGYSEAALAEEKTAQERAALRLQLAQGELAQRQSTRKAKMGQDILMGGLPTGPQGAAPTGMIPMGATPAGATQPQALRDITMNDVRRAMAVDPELGKSLSDILKLQGERYKIAMNGTVYDTAEKKYVTGLQIPGQTPATFTIPEIGDKLSMMPWQYEQYQNYREKGMGTREGHGKRLGEKLHVARAGSSGSTCKVSRCIFSNRAFRYVSIKPCSKRKGKRNHRCRTCQG